MIVRNSAGRTVPNAEKYHCDGTHALIRMGRKICTTGSISRAAKRNHSDNDTKGDAASGGDRESYQNPARAIFRMR